MQKHQSVPQPWDQRLTRRQFLRESALASAAGFMMLSGCAVDPVTGKQQLMMVSRDQEVAIDKQQSPFQFSSDYGRVEDAGLNRYISEVGTSMLPHVHRPDMPYNFQCVNAVYINAYAFPGGSIAVTRGILLELDNEAELAGLLGHELGHVNARHTAEQVSKGQVSSILVAGLSIFAEAKAGLGSLTQQLGGLGQGMFLARYSRENEREADALGHGYMVKAGHGSKGFVGLMEMLNDLNKAQPTSAQMLFSTHPMSSERLSLAVQRDNAQYAHTRNKPLNRDRYMDHTANIRKKEKAIRRMQEGEKHMAKKDYANAHTAFRSALKQAKNDYAANLLMAKCYLARQQPAQALPFADAAVAISPKEPQGQYMAGLAAGHVNKFGQAYERFSQCDALLPGNPQVTFYKGFSQEKMGRRQGAANDYAAYLKMVGTNANSYSQYAYRRLKAWGYAR